MSVATQNTQGLNTELEIRCWKQYLIEEKVDICCVTETHTDERRAEMMKDILADKFHCITKIRKNSKRRDYGSGGLAIIVVKRGCDLIKKKAETVMRYYGERRKG